MYGLVVDRYVDERLDPVRATHAAATYLRDLHQRFGAWPLAMAAYNMGHGGMLRSIQRYNTNDFWSLTRYEAAIPWETTLYVPKIMAIATVMHNKKAFGIEAVEEEAPLLFDTIEVGPNLSLRQVADAVGATEDTLVELNPHLLKKKTPPLRKGVDQTKWRVYVPRGTGPRALQALASASPGKSNNVAVLVRFGDTLDTLAYRYHSDAKVLRRLNALRLGEELETGQTLVVPPLEKDQRPLPDVEEYVVVPGERFYYRDRRRLFYRTLSGDTPSGVANAFDVTVPEVLAWNGLSSAAKLQSGMTLQIYAPKQASLERVRAISPGATRILERGTPEFIEFFEEKNGRRRVTIRALQGDTLAKIGRRYGMSSGMMERINHFSRNKPLSLGEPVIVYTKRPVAEHAKAEPAKRPLPPLKPLEPSGAQASAKKAKGADK
jgi:membrane-bound lytic murein transglycosylase D